MKFFLFIAVVVCANAEFIPFDVFHYPSAAVETENSGFDEEGHELYQGDMILDEEQLEELESPVDTRKGRNDERYRWPNARVPYTVDSNYTVGDRTKILRGIQLWEENTCIRFVKVAATYNETHLVFKDLEDCYSHVGRAYFRKQGQTVSLGRKCLATGVIAHEIGHALGFHHEQSRPDRDDYVVVLTDNIKPTKIHNFKKEKIVNDFSIPYDLSSIMHYGVESFSSNDRYTMLTKDPLKHFVIGQRNGLSFGDIKLGNLMYKCGENCGTKVTCSNGGFVDKNCRCVCPPGFSGSSCQQEQANTNAELSCGGAVDRPSTIRSPNYPGNYPVNSKCVWVVTAPVGRRVRAQFNNFEVNERWRGERCYLAVFEVRSISLYDGIRYCGTELRGETVTSESNTMVFVFTSFEFNNFAGFEIDINFV